MNLELQADAMLVRGAFLLLEKASKYLTIILLLSSFVLGG